MKTYTANDNTARWYHYGYDALNRITSATGSSSNYNLGLVQYDKNGNIERLTRNGHRDVNVTSFGLMDDLTYSYTGNQLQAVDDANPSSSVTGFVDGMELQTEYTYDGNGNMITDGNKGITGIGYNHLNLPTNIVINNSNHNGTIDYIYDATGSKLRKTAEGSITEYAGNYVYSGGGVNTALQFFAHPEGYVAPDGQGGYTYVYQYKDHLGNIRVSYAENNGSAEMIEENNYYPFGLKHKGYNDGQFSSLGNDVAQKWKFGGKEYDESLGLETYDFGARNYNPDLGRWMNLDPLADKNSYESPFVYVSNSPIYYVDPNGEDKIKALLVFNHSNRFIVDFDDKTGIGSIRGIRTTNDGLRFVKASFDTNDKSFNLKHFNSDGNGQSFSADNFEGFESLSFDNLSTVSGESFDIEGFTMEARELSEQEFAEMGTYFGGQIMRSQRDENNLPSIHGDFIRLFENKGEDFGPLKNGRSYFGAISDVISNDGEGETFRVTIENVNAQDFDLFNVINAALQSDMNFNLTIILNNEIEKSNKN